MAKTYQKRSQKSGLPPGTPIHIGEKRIETSLISVLNYNDSWYQENSKATATECLNSIGETHITWISVRGLHDIQVVQQFASGFGLHPLVVEDIVNTEQRPKLEAYDPYLFLVLKWIYRPQHRRELASEQVSLILGRHIVLSFEEGPEDIFQQIRGNIREGKGRIRKMGPDYLAYALLDAVVDHYFSILEYLGEEIERLEEVIVSQPKPETLHLLHYLKRDMILLRKSVWPLREVVAHLERGETPLIQQPTTVYLRDVYDHTIQVIETTETYRDMLSSMLDIYLTSLSNKLNETMKVLTIMATLFIPLTLIAGIYGMNFTYMPELDWPWGYPAVLTVMVLIAGGMLFFFRKKNWL